MIYKILEKGTGIEAVQWTGGNNKLCNSFIGDGLDHIDYTRCLAGEIVILTSKGNKRGDVGDWIIRNSENEFSVMNTLIFETIYKIIN